MWMNRAAAGEEDKRKAFKVSMLVLFGALALGGFIFSNATGSVNVPLADIFRAIFTDEESMYRQVIWNVRLPRSIVGALVGMNLALAGAILQGVMRNPLADPGIIGISAGAGFSGIIILILFPESAGWVPPASFAGAFSAAVLIYILAWKGGSVKPMRIILAGVAVSALLGAGISALMVFFADRVHGAIMFMSGGLSARSWPQLNMIFPYSAAAFPLALLTVPRLNILALGDKTARGLGLHVERNRLFLTALAAVLAASAVSVAGLIGFVGLIVPHTVRLLVGSNYRYLIPASALLGAGVLVISDTFARILFSPVEIPVGILMAVLGVPFFLFLLRRSM